MSGEEAKITVANEKGHLSKYELERMIADAETDAKDDEIRHSGIEAKNLLELYCFNTRKAINDERSGVRLNRLDERKISNYIEDSLKWLERNAVREILLTLFLRYLICLFF